MNFYPYLYSRRAALSWARGFLFINITVFQRATFHLLDSHYFHKLKALTNQTEGVCVTTMFVTPDPYAIAPIGKKACKVTFHGRRLCIGLGRRSELEIYATRIGMTVDFSQMGSNIIILREMDGSGRQLRSADARADDFAQFALLRSAPAVPTTRCTRRKAALATI
jgi:hypothetical protein